MNKDRGYAFGYIRFRHQEDCLEILTAIENLKNSTEGPLKLKNNKVRFKNSTEKRIQPNRKGFGLFYDTIERKMESDDKITVIQDGNKLTLGTLVYETKEKIKNIDELKLLCLPYYDLAYEETYKLKLDSAKKLLSNIIKEATNFDEENQQLIEVRK